MIIEKKDRGWKLRGPFWITMMMSIFDPESNLAHFTPQILPLGFKIVLGYNI